jgi:hypothetical protein
MPNLTQKPLKSIGEIRPCQSKIMYERNESSSVNPLCGENAFTLINVIGST